MKKIPRVSEAEWEVMKAVWKKAPCSAPDVIDALASTTHWGPATIKTLLNRLIRKGALRFERNGKAYVYWPAVTAEELQARETQSFLDRVFDGSLSPMLASFARARGLSAQELDALEKILRDGREQP